MLALAVAACCVSDYFPTCWAEDSITNISKVEEISKLPAVKSLGLRSNKSKISIAVKAPTAADVPLPAAPFATSPTSSDANSSSSPVQTALHLPPASLPTPLPASLPGPFPGNSFPGSALPAPAFTAPALPNDSSPSVGMTAQPDEIARPDSQSLPIVIHSTNVASSDAPFPVTSVADSQRTQVKFQAPPAMPKPQAAVGKVVMRLAETPKPAPVPTTHMPSVVVSKNGLVQSAPEIKQESLAPSEPETRKGVRVSISGQSSQQSPTEAAPQVTTSRPPELIRQNRSASVATTSDASRFSAAELAETQPTPSDGVVRMKLSASQATENHSAGNKQAGAPEFVADSNRVPSKGMVDLAQVAPRSNAATPVREAPAMERNAPAVVALPEHPPILNRPTAPVATSIASQAAPIALDNGVVPAGAASAGGPPANAPTVGAVTSGPTGPVRSAAVVDIECLTAASIPMQSTVVRVAVVDEDVCKVIPSGKAFSVVGNKVGRTQVSVWTADGGGKPTVVDINVVQPWHKTAGRNDDIGRAQTAIATMYPSAKVELKPMPDGSLDVRGLVDNEDTARKVIDLVRKMFLVPVTDHVKSIR